MATFTEGNIIVLLKLRFLCDASFLVFWQIKC